MMFGRGCRRCASLEDEVRWLREQLAAQATQRDRLLDRVAAVARPELAATLAADPRAECSTWAHDEHGTVLMLNGQEVPLTTRADGVQCVPLDGELVPLDEFQRWMARAQAEAAGTSPGAHDG